MLLPPWRVTEKGSGSYWLLVSDVLEASGVTLRKTSVNNSGGAASGLEPIGFKCLTTSCRDDSHTFKAVKDENEAEHQDLSGPRWR